MKQETINGSSSQSASGSGVSMLEECQNAIPDDVDWMGATGAGAAVTHKDGGEGGYEKLELWKRGEIDWDGTRLIPEDAHDKESVTLEKLESNHVRRLLVNLWLDSLPSSLTLLALLNPNGSSHSKPRVHLQKASSIGKESLDSTNENQGMESWRTLEVHGVRILKLTERTSSVMKVSEADEYPVQDPVVNIFRTFGQLNNVAVSESVAVLHETAYADTLTSKASDLTSDLVLIHWSETGSVKMDKVRYWTAPRIP